MAEKFSQPEVVFVGPEEEVDWESCRWSSEDVFEDIRVAYQAYLHASADLYRDEEKYTALFNRAAWAFLPTKHFSKTDLLRLRSLVQTAYPEFGSKGKAVKGPISARDVRTLYLQVLRLAEVEAGTSGQ